jgi:hypothetical protein
VLNCRTEHQTLIHTIISRTAKQSAGKEGGVRAKEGAEQRKEGEGTANEGRKKDRPVSRRQWRSCKSRNRWDGGRG